VFEEGVVEQGLLDDALGGGDRALGAAGEGTQIKYPQKSGMMKLRLRHFT
jgi:hypothetical protein